MNKIYSTSPAIAPVEPNYSQRTIEIDREIGYRYSSEHPENANVVDMPDKICLLVETEVEPNMIREAVIIKLNFDDRIFKLNPTYTLFKRLFDILFSFSVLILGSPIYILLIFITKITSSGPGIYKQERVGKNGQRFNIFKFRSMYVNAEKDGPQLSHKKDSRITKWGRMMRCSRIDELPQFWNVLRGEMSVVGPRPERQHFIDKILEVNPEYNKLLTIKPGITSMGQIKFGYAENIEQMCIRMQHDLKYLENITLRSDIKIILKTLRVMAQCKGK